MNIVFLSTSYSKDDVYLFVRFTKPATFADCVGDELPYGWEQSYNSVVGMYYINHLTRKYLSGNFFELRTVGHFGILVWRKSLVFITRLALVIANCAIGETVSHLAKIN